MELNADFGKRVVVHTNDVVWTASPMPGVDRRMLDRIGAEVARATTVVRYAPNSAFSPHTHTGGEEFVVLSGVFQDEHGDYPAGSYVRNPPTSRHTPRSDAGCVILVKLWQFDPDDRNQFHKRMDDTLQEAVDKVASGELHADDRERVTYHVAQPGAALEVVDAGGIELFVLEGDLDAFGEELRAGSWLRLPDGEALSAVAGTQGARIWMKTGHLRFATAPTP